MTTMEGERILRFLEEQGWGLPDLHSVGDVSTPPCTTNHAAACYLEEKFPPAGEEAPWEYQPCLFLNKNTCTIYPVRPFGCRSFGSVIDCGTEGSAEAPEWFISLNLFVMQLIEDLDRGGCWGNMFAVLGYLSGSQGAGKLRHCETIPGFLVHGEEGRRVISFLAHLRSAVGENDQLKDIYKLLGRSIRREA